MSYYVSDLMARLQEMRPNRKIDDSLIDQLIARRPCLSSESLKTIWAWYEDNEGIDDLADAYGECCGLVSEFRGYEDKDDDYIYRCLMAAVWLRDRVGAHIKKRIKSDIAEGKYWKIEAPDDSTLRYTFDGALQYEIEKCVGGDYRARVPNTAWRIFPTLERAQIASPSILPPIPTHLRTLDDGVEAA